MTVTVKHSKTNAISDWTQAQLDEQIALGNFPAGTTLANIVLPSDWNNDHTLTGVGTMAEQNANSVAITGGTATLSSVTTPSVTATTNNLTLSAISTGVVRLQTANGIAFTARDNGTTIANYISSVGTSGVPYLVAEGSGTNVSTAFSSKGTGSVSLWTNNAAQVQFSATHTASAVNYVQVTGAATTALPTISAQGSDAGIALAIQAKGGSPVIFQNSSSQRALRVDCTGTGVNYFNIVSSAASQAPIFSIAAASSDTNVSMAFQPKGTGAIDLATGSSGVNISNGGTVTAVTRTNQGTGYTTLPTWTASAPTTAGGVTASGSATSLGGVSATIVNGGTGYTAGNVLTVSGGTFSSASTITVNTVSGGVITSATLTNGGTYTVIPANPASVTGGTGTGATFNVSYGIVGLTTSVAGSGYIEQPTVTFSGGGGSGAAAYATVGSGTTVTTLGSSLTLQTPTLNANNTFLQLKDDSTNAASQTGFYIVGASSSLGRLALRSSKALYVSSGSSNNITFTTGSSSTIDGATQFQIANTASAVNYVQVTGGTTGNQATISAQGSDANVGLIYTSKGTSSLQFRTNNSSQTQLFITHTANAVNYASITGSAAGAAPAFSVAGTDTNIDLALTPKGTGVVRFGTYTANMALTVQGYIEIKDSGGTLRKLAVIA